MLVSHVVIAPGSFARYSRMPSVDVPHCQDDFRLGIRFYQFLGKADSWKV